MNIRHRFELLNERAGVVKPGLPLMPHGVERHIIPGGGSRGIQIDRGDEISIVDREGLQRAEMVFFAPDGSSDAGMLGAKGGGKPKSIISLLASGEPSGLRVLQALKKSGFDIEKGDAFFAFSEGSKSGDSNDYQSSVDGLLIIAAPGEAMLPEAQDTPTELIVYIRRASPGEGKGGLTPPEPLATPIHDINIQPGQAKSYEVKAGQFVQIIDVQGRECSDFQAFSLRALEKGLERDIDPTTTRSLMGSLYPTPGIFSKYWTMDHEPLVEIVQDTCGRHDTFGLACTARYYEDLGYPGHINCSDNMNSDLKRFDIKPRGGWPAINFFFNTMLDDLNAIGMDEPWSRPGDFVLLRALTDLICISTGCPCDVDPANGWNPTDIQVRSYGANEHFQRSIGWRKTAEAEMKETKETGFHKSFSKYTRNFIEYNGYWLANFMRDHGAIEEYWACRENVAIIDLSPLRKYEVTGPDAHKLLQLCVTRNMEKLSIGEVVYTAMCYDHGGMIDDGTIYKLGDNNFRWIGGNDTGGLWLREQAEKNGFNAWVRNSTDQLSNVAVQGPNSRDLLAKLFWTSPTQPKIGELAWFRFSVARLKDFHGPACVISRTGYSGELGYEIFCHPKDAEEIFDAIWNLGQSYRLKPMGLEALNLLRVEAGLIFAGYEFTDQINPFEAGIGFTVPLKTKKAHFIGREALEARKLNPQRVLVGLDIESGIIPNSGDCVRIGKAQIGEITSAIRSPILEKTIALARIDVTHAELGTSLQIGQLDGQQKKLKANVVRFPHFDPTKERVKGNYN
ncbi:MAG: DUF1989 domain-containing protein [Pseudomonadota bacterium]|nr:DUF1989 domain-containing protein [Pseudomonadota bacterium]